MPTIFSKPTSGLRHDTRTLLNIFHNQGREAAIAYYKTTPEYLRDNEEDKEWALGMINMLLDME